MNFPARSFGRWSALTPMRSLRALAANERGEVNALHLGALCL